MSGPMAITAFVVSLVAAIMLHELGHFATARRFGMRADRYFLGFGPTVWSTRRGETEYGVKALPLGGFVRIVGMSDDDLRQPPVVDEVFPASGTVATDDLQRLAAVLAERGTPAEVAERIVRRARHMLDTTDDVQAVRAGLHEILVTEVSASRRVGDLPHRLLYGDAGRFFHDRSAWQRAIVLVSGSVAHFAIAIAVLVGAYAFLPIWTGEFVPRVAAVEPASPADDAGLLPGDQVIGVDGQRSSAYAELREAIRDRPDEQVTLTVVRDGRELELNVTPEAVLDPAADRVVGVVGFAPEPELERMRPVEAIEHAIVGQPSLGDPGGFVPMFTGSISALVNVFSPSGIGDILAQATGSQERSIDGAVSVVGAASIAGQLGDGALGLVVFLGLIAVVNIFIGIFNLVPLPPLDGGHLAALGIERSVNLARQLRGKTPDYRLDPRAVAAVAVPVLALLAVVVIALLWLDITDPIRIG